MMKSRHGEEKVVSLDYLHYVHVYELQLLLFMTHGKPIYFCLQQRHILLEPLMLLR